MVNPSQLYFICNEVKASFIFLLLRMPDRTLEEKSWPGYTGQCNPEVWNEKAKPPQPKQSKIGQLTEAQIDEYFREVSFIFVRVFSEIS